MDWTSLQLIGTAIMIACYMYADRRRLRAMVRSVLLDRLKLVQGWVKQTHSLLTLAYSGTTPGNQRITTLDLHTPAADGTELAGA